MLLCSTCGAISVNCFYANVRSMVAEYLRSEFISFRLLPPSSTFRSLISPPHCPQFECNPICSRIWLSCLFRRVYFAMPYPMYSFALVEIVILIAMYNCNFMFAKVRYETVSCALLLLLVAILLSKNSSTLDFNNLIRRPFSRRPLAVRYFEFFSFSHSICGLININCFYANVRSIIFQPSGSPESRTANSTRS